MARLRFIPIETLLEMKENEEDFMLVDARSETSYRGGHIPGAIHLSDEEAEKLDKGRCIVVYCGSYHCHASTRMARKLMEMGFKQVLDFKAGIKGWTDGELELEKS